MFCVKCGSEIGNDVVFCPVCGTSIAQQSNSDQHNSQLKGQYSSSKSSKSIPAFILGLIGAILAIFGGLCVSVCYGFTGNDMTPFILITGGGIVGLITSKGSK